MKNRITKLVIGTIVLGLFAFNMLFSYSLDNSSTSLSAIISTTNANAEDWETCYLSVYGGGDYGTFGFCGYESNYISCECGRFYHP